MPSAITLAGLGGFPGGVTQTFIPEASSQVGVVARVHSQGTRSLGAPRGSSVDHLAPHVFLLPPCVTAAPLPAKIATPLLACLALDTRNPKSFDGGRSPWQGGASLGDQDL